jgi:hypothetical protein
MAAVEELAELVLPKTTTEIEHTPNLPMLNHKVNIRKPKHRPRLFLPLALRTRTQHVRPNFYQ